MKHVPNPSFRLSPTQTDEIIEWLRNPMVKTHPSISQGDITVPNPSLESNINLFHPPSSTSHDSLHHDSLERSTSQVSCAKSLDYPNAGSSCSHVQGNIIIQVEEEDGEEKINSSQNIKLPFLIDRQSTNLGETSCTIDSLDQPPVLGFHHFHASVCCDEHPSTSYDILSSHVHSNLDLECALVEEDIHIKSSSAPHLPVYPIIHSASTCIRDTLVSLVSSSYELSPRSIQGNGVVHDENSLNTQDSSHSSSSCVLHEDNCSSQLTRNFDEAYDRDGCHPKRSFEISNNNHPQDMHDLVHISKYNFSILDSFKTCQVFKALQHQLMLMLGPHDSGKPTKPNQISFLMHNPSICMVVVDVDPYVKNIYYSSVIFQNFRFSLMIESTSPLQHVHLHEPLLHPIQVGSVHPSFNHGTMKLIIKNTMFI